MDEFLDEKINLFSSINEKDMNGLSALEKLLSYTVSEEEAKGTSKGICGRRTGCSDRDRW